MQGLQRVGRFYDKCRRYLVAGVQLIDKDLENAYNARLITSMKPAPKNVQDPSKIVSQ
jgi:hypothetical protein